MVNISSAKVEKPITFQPLGILPPCSARRVSDPHNYEE